jgi:hypothetical protein
MNIKKLNEKTICDLYKSKNTLQQIAKSMGCKSYGPIKRILTENGIELRKKGELRARGKLSVDIKYFGNIDTKEKAYWLGVLTADGYITADNYKVVLSSKDKELISNFKEAVSSEHKLARTMVYDKRTEKTYRRYSIQIGCKNFVSNLLKLGMTNRKSYYEIPPNINDEFFPDYIRGVFDGDGSVCTLKKSGNLRINIIATENILLKIQGFLVNNIGASKTKFSVVAEDGGNKICKMYINRKLDQVEFLKLIYKSSTEKSRLTRKFDKSKIYF